MAEYSETVLPGGAVVRELITTESEVMLQPITLTRLQFMERFTDAELVAIYDAASVSTAVLVWLEKLRATEQITLTDPRTVAGVQALEAQKLIEVGRVNEILTPVDNGRAVNEY